MKKSKLVCGLLLVFLAVVVLSGCQGPQAASKPLDEVLVVEPSQCSLQYGENIKASTEAINAGDLDKAESHILAVKDCAESFEQEREVESLERVISGARAMMAGEVNVAKAQWSQIRDPHLNREVRLKAESVIGVEVPMVPQGKENE